MRDLVMNLFKPVEFLQAARKVTVQEQQWSISQHCAFIPANFGFLQAY